VVVGELTEICADLPPLSQSMQDICLRWRVLSHQPIDAPGLWVVFATASMRLDTHPSRGAVIGCAGPLA
jgi:hypothetical protein